jgi:hypothetical protein
MVDYCRHIRRVHRIWVVGGQREWTTYRRLDNYLAMTVYQDLPGVASGWRLRHRPRPAGKCGEDEGETGHFVPHFRFPASKMGNPASVGI